MPAFFSSSFVYKWVLCFFIILLQYSHKNRHAVKDDRQIIRLYYSPNVLQWSDISNRFALSGSERETEIKIEREGEKVTDRDKDWKRGRERERVTDRDKDWKRERDRQTEIKIEREGETDIDKDWKRERQTEIKVEIERQTDRKR